MTLPSPYFDLNGTWYFLKHEFSNPFDVSEFRTYIDL